MTINHLEPLLKWAGGKRWIAQEIYDIYKELELDGIAEPFCGGASISFYIQPKYLVLNDINESLIGLYRAIGENSEFNLDSIDTTNTRECYLKNRDLFNSLDSEEDLLLKSKLFYYMNRTCFRGLCRFSKKTGFNVNFGDYKKPTLLNDFSEYHPLLNRAMLLQGQFTNIGILTTNFLLFSDPPYDKTFVGYAEGGFSWNDQVMHATWLANQVCPVITTNSATPRILDLYKMLGFNVCTYEARRSISAGGQRDNEIEMIAFKNVPNFKNIEWITEVE